MVQRYYFVRNVKWNKEEKKIDEKIKQFQIDDRL